MPTIPYTAAESRAMQVLRNAGAPDPADVIERLRAAGLALTDPRTEDFQVRWVSVAERPVPPEADTIIRTITRTVDGVSTQTTHWLEGLRGPAL